MGACRKGFECLVRTSSGTEACPLGATAWNHSLPGETRGSEESRDHALLGRQFHQYVLWKEWILPVMGVVLTPSWWPPPVPDKLTQRGSSSANGTVAPLAHGVTSVTWPPGASWRAAAGLYLRCSRPNQLQSLHENSQPCWRLLSSAWHRTSENSSSVPDSSFRTEFQCREGSRGAVRSAAASCASHSS